MFLRFGYYAPSTFANRIQYYFHNVKAGKKHETKGLLFVRNKGKITIGNNVRINSSAKANPIGCGTKTYFQVLPGGELKIGNGSRMSNCAITVATSVIIGENVRIGSGVHIYDTNFHSLDPYKRTAFRENRDDISSKPIEIMDYAFIGAGAYILKGVKIGKGSIVGAGSVVTKNIPDMEIWGGNPAVKIGRV